jgi:hypothetical protein
LIDSVQRVTTRIEEPREESDESVVQDSRAGFPFNQKPSLLKVELLKIIVVYLSILTLLLDLCFPGTCRKSRYFLLISKMSQSRIIQIIIKVSRLKRLFNVIHCYFHLNCYDFILTYIITEIILIFGKC